MILLFLFLLFSVVQYLYLFLAASIITETLGRKKLAKFGGHPLSSYPPVRDDV